MKVWKQFLKFIQMSLLLMGLFQLFLLGPVSTFVAAEERFIVRRTSLPGNWINGLVWWSDELKPQIRKTGQRVEPYVLLKGTYTKPKYDLYAYNRLVSRTASGAFEIKVAFKEKPIQLNLRAVGPAGALETEEVLLIKLSKKDSKK
jgi:hypothetical protein